MIKLGVNYPLYDGARWFLSGVVTKTCWAASPWNKSGGSTYARGQQVFLFRFFFHHPHYQRQPVINARIHRRIFVIFQLSYHRDPVHLLRLGCNVTLRMIPKIGNKSHKHTLITNPSIIIIIIIMLLHTLGYYKSYFLRHRETVLTSEIRVSTSNISRKSQFFFLQNLLLWKGGFYSQSQIVRRRHVRRSLKLCAVRKVQCVLF